MRGGAAGKKGLLGVHLATQVSLKVVESNPFTPTHHTTNPPPSPSTNAHPPPYLLHPDTTHGSAVHSDALRNVNSEVNGENYN